MKILMVLDYISEYNGGSQIAMFSWTQNLIKEGHDVKVLTNKNILAIKDKYPFVDYIIFPSLPLGKMFAHISLPLLLTKYVKKEILKFDPDIIHFHEQLTVDMQVMKWAKKNKIKFITSYHGNLANFQVKSFPFSIFVYKNSWWNKILRYIQNKCIEMSPLIITPSETVKTRLKKTYDNKIFVVQNPISSYFFNRERKEKKKNPIELRLITVSRIEGEKNIGVLIEMMLHISNATLTIVGDGIDLKFYKNLVKHLGLESKIKFTGWIDHVKLPEIYETHDVFVSASDFETFGLMYIEALASGLPCVVYDYSVTREVIPNDMAIFVTSFNPKEWAEAIILLESQLESMQKQINNDYKKLIKYHEKNSTHKLLDIYNYILAH